MLQIMGNYICLNKIIIAVLATLPFIACAPAEPKLELQLEKQAVGQIFSFADYCEAEYDSIYLIHPYSDGDAICSLPYQMSQRLREKCSYTQNDAYTRILFIDNGVVKAYSETGCKFASFSFIELPEEHPVLSLEQKIFLDEDRFVHLFKE